MTVSPKGEAGKRDVFEFASAARDRFRFSFVVPAEDRGEFASVGEELETWKPSGPIGMYYAPRLLLRAVAKSSADVIWTHGLPAAAVALGALPPGLAGRCVATFHDDPRHKELPERFIAQRFGPFLARAAARTAVSAALARALAKRSGADPASFTIVPHGINTAAIGDLERPAGRPGPVVGWFGRIGADAAWERGLDAVKIVKKRLPEARYVAGGDGPSVSLAANFGRAELGGAFELRTAALSARDLFGAIDMLVIPSTADVLPHAVLEALCWGVPAIGADVGAIAEAIAPFETGWIVPDNARGFADGILDAWPRIDAAWAGARAQRTAARDRFSRETVDASMRAVLVAAAVRDRDVVQQRSD